MSRTALKALIVAIMLGATGSARAIDPHLDPGLLPDGCIACHRGHGKSRSPMLPAAQVDLCLSCHDSQTRLEQRTGRTAITPGTGSTFLASTLANPYVHPMSEQAFSRHEPGAVTCTSCHSPHRGLPRQAAGAAGTALRKRSPRNPNRLEYELCGDCHGGGGRSRLTGLDVNGLLGQNNRSYHPVQAPAAESSASIVPALAGREINCTDCHGNSDPTGPRGPHGSMVRYILRSEYNTFDGSPESPTAYALCYTCHDRDRVLNSTSFPAHRLHIIEQRTSCATCHDPHGSSRNRALIRFGDETSPPGVSASIGAGTLAYVSSGPGEGSCYLTCHGSDHSPRGYGGLEPASLQQDLDPAEFDRQREIDLQKVRTPTPK